jgi:uncharacterized peroxidase-related enzyme
VDHHGAALTRESGEATLAEAVASGDLDRVPDRIRLLCRYALELTTRPWDVREQDLLSLRRGGMSDRDIVDANQVVAYFNYVNRIADGLGVELEPYWPDEVRARRSYLLRRLDEHRHIDP